jgi:hypothetical protein
MFAATAPLMVEVVTGLYNAQRVLKLRFVRGAKNVRLWQLFGGQQSFRQFPTETGERYWL